MKKILRTLVVAGITGVLAVVPALGRPTFGAGTSSGSATPPALISGTTASSGMLSPVDHRAQQAWFYGQRAAPGTTIPAGAWLRAYHQRALVHEHVRTASGAARASFAPTGIWTPLGPAPTEDPSIYHNGNVSGRVTALAYDTTRAILYAGTADGGLWKTADRGWHWTPLTDGQPSLAVGAIALDPTNPQVIYVGTGEANFGLDAYYSAGVLKSTDGGSTWTQLGQGVFGGNHGSGDVHISKIAVDPHTSSHVVVASDRGVYLSTDGGATWTNVLGSTVGRAAMTDLILDPSTTPSTVYAAWGDPSGNSGNGIYKSIDGGATFTGPIGAGYPTGVSIGRISIALAPSNPGVLYLVASDPTTSASLGVWMSSTGGATWTQTALSTADGGPDLLGQQGWYGNEIAVDPADANRVYVGGIDLWGSTDGAHTFTRLSLWNASAGLSPHADQHALVFVGAGSPRPFYAGNDGGVYSTIDGGTTWFDNNGNLAITQFYGGSTTAAFSADPVVYGGTQDNGTQLYTGSPVWNEVYGGDGGHTANDPNNPSTAYEEYVNLAINKTTDGGAHWVPATSGINPADKVLFIAPFIMDPTNPNRLLAGTDHLYETTNGAANWTQISPSLAASTANHLGAISAIAVAPSAPSTIYVGTGDGKVWMTPNNGVTWTDITAGTAGMMGRYVTALAVDPTNAQDVAVTFSGFASINGTGSGTHVYRSTNGGAGWIDISAGLPDSPVTSVLRAPGAPNTLFIGADDGFFFTTDGGATWSQFETGLPNAGIDQVFSDASFTTLFAATHGRGMFTLALTATASLAAGPTSGTPSQTIAVSGATFGTSEAVKVYWDRISTTSLVMATTSAGSFATTFTVPAATAGTHVLIAVGQTSGRMARTPFEVTPTIYLYPTSGKAGSVCYLVGRGFGKSETVAALWYPGLSLRNYATSNTVGTVVVPFIVPTVAPGTNYVIGYGVGNVTSGEYAYAPFAVTAAASTSTVPTGATRQPVVGPPPSPPYPIQVK